MNSSIHTFTYSITCPDKIYNQIYYSLDGLCKQKHSNLHHKEAKKCLSNNSYIKRTYYTHILQDQGINNILLIKLETSDGMTVKNTLQLLINPNKLSGERIHSYTHIIDSSKLSEIPCLIKNLFSQILPEIDFSSLTENGKYNRIDYCMNFWFESQEEAKEYMKLLKKAQIPSGLTPLTFRDTKQHRNIPGKHDITLKCKSYELSMYLKQTQMKSKKTKYKYPQEEIENAYGQLRIELRTSRRKLYHEKKSNHCSEDELITNPDKISMKTFCRKLYKMYGSGDFYRFRDAYLIIENSHYQNRVKEEMLNILSAVSRKRSLDPSQNQLDRKYIKKYLPYFNDIDLSPITIPEKSLHDYYPNPYKYMAGLSAIYIKRSDITLREDAD